MIVRLTRSYRFEAAHHLPNVPEAHKCRRLHGHSFRFDVTVEGPIDPHLGWLMDFAEIDAAVEPVRKQVDHYYLNEIEGLENATSEVVAGWLWDRIKPRLPQLVEIAVRETCTSACTYRGPALASI